MKFLIPEYLRVDERGRLTQLFSGEWKQVNFLEFNGCSTLGGHYHKNRTEIFLVLEGYLTLNNKIELRPGDMVKIEPGDMHTFSTLGHARAIEFLSEPFNEEDTWK